jgi:hypothetical protein
VTASNGSTDNMGYPQLVEVEWIDTTNIATWEDLDDLAAWARDGGFVCRNVGYLTYEDDACVVLSARMAIAPEPPQHGLFERIPKGVITRRRVVEGEWPKS